MKHRQTSNGQGDATVVLDAPWSEIEARFRVWSFRVYYDKLFATEIDNTKRFCKALIASSQPIRDRQKVIDWYKQRASGAQHRRRKRGARADAPAIPA